MCNRFYESDYMCFDRNINGKGMFNFWSVIICLCNGPWNSLYDISTTIFNFLRKVDKLEAQFYFVEFKHFSESRWRIQILPLLLLHWVSCWFSLSLFTQFQPTILLLILQTPMDSWISAISDVWSNSSSTPSMVSKIPTLPTIGDKKRWVQNFEFKGMTIKWV